MDLSRKPNLFRDLSEIWTRARAPEWQLGRPRLVGRWATDPATGRAVFGWVQASDLMPPVSIRASDQER